MQIRKDPISMNWVVQEDGETTWPNFKVCPFCPGQEALTPQTIYSHADGKGAWDVRVTPHVRPLYRIEGTCSGAPRAFTTRCATWERTKW